AVRVKKALYIEARLAWPVFFAAASLSSEFEITSLAVMSAPAVGIHLLYAPLLASSTSASHADLPPPCSFHSIESCSKLRHRRCRMKSREVIQDGGSRSHPQACRQQRCGCKSVICRCACRRALFRAPPRSTDTGAAADGGDAQDAATQ